MKNYISKTIEAITEYLNDLSSDELISIHNEYCQAQNYSDYEIYDNDEEFFNMFFEGKVIEAVRAVSFGEYNYSDDYVKFNSYGNLETFGKYGMDKHIDIPAIAADILENEANYYNIELEETEEENEG